MVGWQIGEGINAIFAEIGLGAGSAPEPAGLTEEFCVSSLCSGRIEYYPYGASVFNEATVQQTPGAYLYSGSIVNSTGVHGGWNGIRWFEPPCTFSGFTPPPQSHLEKGVPGGTSCAVGLEHPALLVDYPYVTPEDLLGHQVFHRYDPELDGKPTLKTAAPEDPGVEAVTGVVEEELDKKSKELLQAYLDWALLQERQPEENPAEVGVPPSTQTSGEKTCRPAGASIPADPGVAPEGYEGTDPASVPMDTFPKIFDPVSKEPRAVKLWWGMESWGYRHIWLRHGWDPSDRLSTELALTEPSAIVPEPRSATARRYYRYYLAQDAVTECTRRVIVEWNANNSGNFPAEGEPEPYFVITSFAYPFNENSDPAEGLGLE